LSPQIFTFNFAIPPSTQLELSRITHSVTDSVACASNHAQLIPEKYFRRQASRSANEPVFRAGGRTLPAAIPV
jgi:hypothetical protein